MTPRTLLALALLLSACGDDDDTGTRDASTDAAQPTDAFMRDAPDLYEWEAAGCEVAPTCISYPGPAPTCPSVHDYIAEEPGERHNEDCRRWLRCPLESGGICLMCREWSSNPSRIVEPDPEASSQPECSEGAGDRRSVHPHAGGHPGDKPDRR